jgi:hypothetical protein
MGIEQFYEVLIHAANGADVLVERLQALVMSPDNPIQAKPGGGDEWSYWTN